jgi:hypothetical protein
VRDGRLNHLRAEILPRALAGAEAEDVEVVPELEVNKSAENLKEELVSRTRAALTSAGLMVLNRDGLNVSLSLPQNGLRTLIARESTMIMV